MMMASEPTAGMAFVPVGGWVISSGGAPSAQRVSRRIPAVLTALPLVTDSVAIATGYALAGLPNPLLATVIVVTCLALAGTYRRRLTLSGLDVAPTVTVAAGIGAVLATLIVGEHIWLRDIVVPVGAASAAALVARFIAYSLARILRHSHSLRSRVVVVGADAVGTALAQRMLTEPEYGLEPVLVVDREPLATVSFEHRVPVHPIGDSLVTALRENRVDAAVIAFPRLEDAEFTSLLADFERLRYQIFVVPRLWDGGCPVGSGLDRIGAVPLMRIRNPLHRNSMRHVKCAGERFIAAAVLLAVAPLLAAVAIAEKLSHPTAPVLFRQTRVGLNGREFQLLKFRSMTPATDLESQTAWTIVGDTRVDTLGRFLRASSIDELPQLWNIVRGDMALIGPRPERPHFVEQFSSTVPGYEARHRVPGGLTGWAAVNGLSGDTSIAERARFDNFYITNWSLWFDIKIILRTVWVLFVRFRGYHLQERLARQSDPTQPIPQRPARHSTERPDIFDPLKNPVAHGGKEPSEGQRWSRKSCDDVAGPLVTVGAFGGHSSNDTEPTTAREDAVGASRS